MKEIKIYICSVDAYRNGTVFRSREDRLYDRHTRGVYLVCAKTVKEAKVLLQKAIRFGSVDIVYENRDLVLEIPMKYKEIRRQVNIKEDDKITRKYIPFVAKQ